MKIIRHAVAPFRKLWVIGSLLIIRIALATFIALVDRATVRHWLGFD